MKEDRRKLERKIHYKGFVENENIFKYKCDVKNVASARDGTHITGSVFPGLDW